MHVFVHSQNSGTWQINNNIYRSACLISLGFYFFNYWLKYPCFRTTRKETRLAYYLSYIDICFLRSRSIYVTSYTYYLKRVPFFSLSCSLSNIKLISIPHPPPHPKKIQTERVKELTWHVVRRSRRYCYTNPIYMKRTDRQIYTSICIFCSLAEKMLLERRCPLTPEPLSILKKNRGRDIPSNIS